MFRRFALFGMLGIVTAVFVANCGPLPPANAAQKKKTKFESIEAIVASHGITQETPGLAFVVVEAKGPPRIGFYGKADVKEKAAFGTDTLCEIASCSKPFTAVAVLILHDQGKLDINDPVRKYLPELPNYYKDQSLKISHLLQHTGGLPDYLSFDDFEPKNGRFWTNEEYVPEFAKQRAKHPADFSPGQKYDYSNTGYMLLSVIVARFSKQSFGEFMHDQIFAPLKMKHTFILERPAARKLAKLPAPTAVGYTHQKKDGWTESWGCPPRRVEKNMVIGDGGVWTNLDDMQKWDQAIRDRALLKQETWAKAHTPSQTRDGKTNDYGFGWDLEFDDKKKLTQFGHSGSWSGFRTYYWHNITKGRTVILLSNRGNFSSAQFYDQLEEFLDRK